MRATLAKLEAAVARGLISRPQRQHLPQDFPFNATLCAVDLPDGCQPPLSGSPRRVATGYAFDADQADFLALAEAAERYSLQFSTARPAALTAFRASGGQTPPTAIEDLTLGAPGTNGRIDSRGCASGTSRGDASIRAVLEALEHRTLSAMLSGLTPCHALPPDYANVAPLESWLTKQFRR
ncbi:MAG: hypothetical protein KDK08_27035, partial [Rhizobiaceae bacterium]|nr:hypothetical protein [Rhizobiaceae bacterium]